MTGDFDCFHYFNFETCFLKNEKLFFKKLEYRFLVERSTKGNATFPCKTAQSKANVKTSRTGSAK